MRALIKIAVPLIAILIFFNISFELFFLLGGDALSSAFVSIKPATDVTAYSTIQLMVKAIPSIIFIYSLYRLLLLFRLFSKEDFFSLDAINHLKWFSGFYMLSTLLNIIVDGILNLWTSNNSDTSITLSLNIESQQLSEFGMAIVFFIIAFILNEARQHKEALEGFF